MQAYTTDTTDDAAAVQLELIRKMAPSERAMKAIRMTTRLIRESKEAIRLNNPGFTKQEVELAFIELHYGGELASAVRAYLKGTLGG